MVGGSRQHSLYANPRQHPPKEQSVLRSRAFYLSTGKQQLSLSGRRPTQLRWPQPAEPHLCLHWNPQTLRSGRANTPMHQRGLPLSRHPHGGTSPATRPRVGEDTRVCPCPAAKKESGSVVRGTQESDRAAASPPAPDKVCSRAVLPGSGGPEHQATRAVSQPTDKPRCARYCLAQAREENFAMTMLAGRKTSLLSYFFNTHSLLHSLRFCDQGAGHLWTTTNQVAHLSRFSKGEYL